MEAFNALIQKQENFDETICVYVLTLAAFNPVVYYCSLDQIQNNQCELLQGNQEIILRNLSKNAKFRRAG